MEVEIMGSSIFLSYPKPFLKKQEEFIERVTQYLQEREIQPRTLGVTDYDMDAPLTAIRRLMLESNGLVTIAFKRSLIKDGIGKPQSDIGEKEYDLSQANSNIITGQMVDKPILPNRAFYGFSVRFACIDIKRKRRNSRRYIRKRCFGHVYARI